MGFSSAAAARGTSICFGIFLLLQGAPLAWSQGVPKGAKPVKAPTTEEETVPDADADEGTGTGTETVKAPPQVQANEDAPVNIRLRSLEQRVQALKERAWRAKARVGMLKESVLGGGVGARAGITHENNMGGSFRLIRLVYSLDGTQVFTRVDESGALHEQKKFDVLTGPVAPGSHTLTVVAEYRGNGYGVFEYMNKYKFKVRASHTFTASEGRALDIRVVGYEKGGASMPLEERPAIEFRVNAGAGKK